MTTDTTIHFYSNHTTEHKTGSISLFTEPNAPTTLNTKKKTTRNKHTDTDSTKQWVPFRYETPSE